VTVNNLDWNRVNGPAYWDLDLALSRRFVIKERQYLELRADAFNLSNSFVPAFPGATPAAQSGTESPISPAVCAFAALNIVQFG
jgi:hypothetical protein